MPDPAAPAPPPAAHLGAAGQEARRHRGRQTRRDRPAAARARPVRPLPQRGPPPPLLDEEDESAAGFDPGLDDLLRRVAGDEARAAARGPDGGAPPSPARASICLQSSDFARSAAKCISKCIQNERICRATRLGALPRAGSRSAARRRPARASICLQPSDLPRSGEKSISNYIHNERICRARRGAAADLGRRGARGGPRGQEGKGMSDRTEGREAERPAARSHAAVAPSSQGDCKQSPEAKRPLLRCAPPLPAIASG